MKTACSYVVFALLVGAPALTLSSLPPPPTPDPIAGEDLVVEETDGLLAMEAEHYYKQTKKSVRQWYMTTAANMPELTPDGDPQHVAGASGGAYLEGLPDTRRSHDDTLIEGENFFPQPGMAGIVSYKIHINTPGRYYVWARIYSTNGEDNGLHVGIDGKWPESGQRLQWIAMAHDHQPRIRPTQRRRAGPRCEIGIDARSVLISFCSPTDGGTLICC